MATLEENIGAAGISLTPEDLSGIAAALEQVEILGHRYSESSQRMVDE